MFLYKTQPRISSWQPSVRPGTGQFSKLLAHVEALTFPRKKPDASRRSSVQAEVHSRRMDKFVAENTLFVVVLAGIGATVIWGLVSKMTDFVMTYFLRGSANVKKLGSWAVVTVRPSSPAAGNERFTCLDSYAPQLYLLTEIVFCAVTSSDVCRDSSTTDENVVRPQGATDGIGKAVAFELAKKGMNIMLVSRTAMKLQEVKEEIAEKFSGIEIKMVPYDFAKATKSDFDNLKDQVVKLEVGLLYNNVGISYEHAEYLQASHAPYDTNACAFFALVLTKRVWCYQDISEERVDAIIEVNNRQVSAALDPRECWVAEIDLGFVRRLLLRQGVGVTAGEDDAHGAAANACQEEGLAQAPLSSATLGAITDGLI
eukprot:2358347-Rhodomonas_salina.1